MSRGPSTAAQRAFIESLGYELRYARQEYGPVETFDDAKATIEFLLNVRRDQWTRQTMTTPQRKDIFRALRLAGKTKEDMYAALGLQSISEASRPTVLTARRCKQWIEGRSLEPDHVPPASSLADALASFTRPEYPRPPRPDGYVPLDPLAADPEFHADPEPAMPDTVTPPVQAAPRRMGRPGLVLPAQPPRRPVLPVVTTAPAPAPAPVVAQQPIGRPMGRPGMPIRPAPVAHPAPEPVVAPEPASATEDTKEATAEPSAPFVVKPNTPPRQFEMKPLPPLDTGLGRVEALTQQRLAVLNQILSTEDGIGYLRRIAMDNAPAWQSLERDFRSDIPF